MASVAFLASAAALSLAAFFSSSVKSVRASIASTLALRASSTAFLAAGFLAAAGSTALTSATPLSFAPFTAVCAFSASSGVAALLG